MNTRKLPALEQVQDILRSQRIKLVFFKCLNVSLLFASIHLIFISVTAFLSVRQPFSLALLNVQYYTYTVYAALGLILVFMVYGEKGKLFLLAKNLDTKNPQMYDAFRTSLSLQNHHSSTLESLNNLYLPGLASIKWAVKANINSRVRLHVVGAVAIWVIMGLWSSNFSSYTLRSFRPGVVIQSIPLLHISVSVDRLKVGMGDTVTVTGVFSNDLSGQQFFAHVMGGRSEKRYQLQVKDHSAFIKIGPVSEDKQIYFSGGNGKSSTVNIKVIERPFLKQVKVTLTPPGYYGLRSSSLSSGSTNFSVLAGTHVSWKLEASRFLKQFIWVEGFSNSDGLKLETGRDTLENEKQFSLERILNFKSSDLIRHLPGFSPKDELKYWYNMEFIDTDGIWGEYPVISVVDVIKDDVPQIHLYSPEPEHMLEHKDSLSLSLLVKDDYGLVSAYLHYRLLSDGYVKDSSRIKVTSWLPGKKGGHIDRVWGLKDLDIQAENTVEYFFSAWDNDKLNGPKRGVSEIRRFYSPSVRELIEKARKQESQAISSLKSAALRQKNVKENLQRVNKQSSSDPLNSIPGFQIKSILVDDPQQQYKKGKELVRTMEQAIKSNKGLTNSKGLKTKLDNFDKALENSLQSIPDPSLIRDTQTNQLKGLEKLMEKQEELKSKAARLQEILNPEKNLGNFEKNQLQNFSSNTQMHLDKQSELKEYLKSEIEGKKTADKLRKQLLNDQQQVNEDLEKAMQDLENFIEQTREKQLFSEDILQKLEEVQELLSQILPDSVRNNMQDKLKGHKLNPGEVKASLENILQNQSEFEQTLNKALAMLHKAKERQKLEEWKQQIDELYKKQSRLSKDIGDLDSDSKQTAELQNLKHSQFSISQKTRGLFNRMKSQSGDSPSLQKAHDDLPRESTLKDMKATEEHLSSKGSKGAKGGSAAKSASSAAKKLQSMIQSLTASSSQLNSSSINMNVGEIERLLNESLGLSDLLELIPQGQTRRTQQGWQSQVKNVYASCYQVSNWINQKLVKMGETNPFISNYLTSQSGLLTSVLKDISTIQKYNQHQSALSHSQNVSRELLKLLKLAQNLPSGSGGESGSGDQPQNEGSSGSMPNLADQLKGLSSQQLAVNQATSQLLKSILQSRSQSPPQQGQNGKGTPQQTGKTPQQLANQQGSLGQKLETMAENANEEGGASQKLRQLAEEARQMESLLRQGSLNSDIIKKQEGFQSRLLEASQSLKERGFKKERKGAQSQKNFSGVTGTARVKGIWIKFLELEKKRMRHLPLTKEEQQLLEKYYESLLIK